MLERLKYYKEVITIILFFLGGFFWISDQFPSKSNLNSEISSIKSDLSGEIQSLNCLLDKYMTLTQLQMNSQALEKELLILEQQITGMSSEVSAALLTPAMKFQLEQFKSDFSHKKEALRDKLDKITAISAELGRNICSKGVSL